MNNNDFGRILVSTSFWPRARTEMHVTWMAQGIHPSMAKQSPAAWFETTVKRNTVERFMSKGSGQKIYVRFYSKIQERNIIKRSLHSCASRELTPPFKYNNNVHLKGEINSLRALYSDRFIIFLS